MNSFLSASTPSSPKMGVIRVEGIPNGQPIQLFPKTPRDGELWEDYKAEMRAVVCRADQYLSEYETSVAVLHDYELQQSMLNNVDHPSARAHEISRDDLKDIQPSFPQMCQVLSDHDQTMASLVRLSESFNQIIESTKEVSERPFLHQSSLSGEPRAKAEPEMDAMQTIFAEMESRKALLLQKLDQTRISVASKISSMAIVLREGNETEVENRTSLLGAGAERTPTEGPSSKKQIRMLENRIKDVQNELEAQLKLYHEMEEAKDRIVDSQARAIVATQTKINQVIQQTAQRLADSSGQMEALKIENATMHIRLKIANQILAQKSFDPTHWVELDTHETLVAKHRNLLEEKTALEEMLEAEKKRVGELRTHAQNAISAREQAEKTFAEWELDLRSSVTQLRTNLMERDMTINQMFHENIRQHKKIQVISESRNQEIDHASQRAKEQLLSQLSQAKEVADAQRNVYNNLLADKEEGNRDMRAFVEALKVEAEQAKNESQDLIVQLEMETKLKTEYKHKMLQLSSEVDKLQKDLRTAKKDAQAFSDQLRIQQSIGEGYQEQVTKLVGKTSELDKQLSESKEKVQNLLTKERERPAERVLRMMASKEGHRRVSKNTTTSATDDLGGVSDESWGLVEGRGFMRSCAVQTSEVRETLWKIARRRVAIYALRMYEKKNLCVRRIFQLTSRLESDCRTHIQSLQDVLGRFDAYQHVCSHLAHTAENMRLICKSVKKMHEINDIVVTFRKQKLADSVQNSMSTVQSVVGVPQQLLENPERPAIPRPLTIDAIASSTLAHSELEISGDPPAIQPAEMVHSVDRCLSDIQFVLEEMKAAPEKLESAIQEMANGFTIHRLQSARLVLENELFGETGEEAIAISINDLDRLRSSIAVGKPLENSIDNDPYDSAAGVVREHSFDSQHQNVHVQTQRISLEERKKTICDVFDTWDATHRMWIEEKIHTRNTWMKEKATLLRDEQALRVALSNAEQKSIDDSSLIAAINSITENQSFCDMVNQLVSRCELDKGSPLQSAFPYVEGGPPILQKLFNMMQAARSTFEQFRILNEEVVALRSSNISMMRQINRNSHRLYGALSRFKSKIDAPEHLQESAATSIQLGWMLFRTKTMCVKLREDFVDAQRFKVSVLKILKSEELTMDRQVETIWRWHNSGFLKMQHSIRTLEAELSKMMEQVKDDKNMSKEQIQQLQSRVASLEADLAELTRRPVVEPVEEPKEEEVTELAHSMQMEKVDLALGVQDEIPMDEKKGLEQANANDALLRSTAGKLLNEIATSEGLKRENGELRQQIKELQLKIAAKAVETSKNSIAARVSFNETVQSVSLESEQEQEAEDGGEFQPSKPEASVHLAVPMNSEDNIITPHSSQEPAIQTREILLSSSSDSLNLNLGEINAHKKTLHDLRNRVKGLVAANLEHVGMNTMARAFDFVAKTLLEIIEDLGTNIGSTPGSLVFANDSFAMDEDSTILTSAREQKKDWARGSFVSARGSFISARGSFVAAREGFVIKNEKITNSGAHGSFVSAGESFVIKDEKITHSGARRSSVTGRESIILENEKVINSGARGSFASAGESFVLKNEKITHSGARRSSVTGRESIILENEKVINSGAHGSFASAGESFVLKNEKITHSGARRSSVSARESIVLENEKVANSGVVKEAATAITNTESGCKLKRIKKARFAIMSREQLSARIMSTESDRSEHDIATEKLLELVDQDFVEMKSDSKTISTLFPRYLPSSASSAEYPFHPHPPRRLATSGWSRTEDTTGGGASRRVAEFLGCGDSPYDRQKKRDKTPSDGMRSSVGTAVGSSSGDGPTVSPRGDARTREERAEREGDDDRKAPSIGKLPRLPYVAVPPLPMMLPPASRGTAGTHTFR